MSEKEMNSYRFASGLDPTDEMLSQIMKEAAEEARKRQAEATVRYFSDISRNSEAKRAKWAYRINSVIDGDRGL